MLFYIIIDKVQFEKEIYRKDKRETVPSVNDLVKSIKIARRIPVQQSSLFLQMQLQVPQFFLTGSLI